LEVVQAHVAVEPGKRGIALQDSRDLLTPKIYVQKRKTARPSKQKIFFPTSIGYELIS
jgi:hypothetical protein